MSQNISVPDLLSPRSFTFLICTWVDIYKSEPVYADSLSLGVLPFYFVREWIFTSLNISILDSLSARSFTFLIVREWIFISQNISLLDSLSARSFTFLICT